MIARSMSFTARPGGGAELAALLHRVAESLQGFPGCAVYLVSREREQPDRVQVFEVWQDEASAQAALTASPADGADTPSPGEVMALLAAPPERVELDVLGGVGLPRPD